MLIGFLTYDLQPFTEDCLYRVASSIGPLKIRAYPVLYHPNQAFARVPFLPSGQRGRYLSVTSPGSTPEGFASNINWRAAFRCAWESEVIVLFGLQGITALVTAALASALGKTLVSVNQTLPLEWEVKRRWWVRRLKRWLLSRCRLHICQTVATQQVLENVYGVHPAEIVSAPFEAGAALFQSLLDDLPQEIATVRSELGIGSESLYLFVGNLHKFKGVQLLLEALALLPLGTEIVCVFAGPEEPTNANGSTISHYISVARKLGIESRVRFTGNLNSKRLARLYAASDVVVLPTYRDMFPKILVEAALAGKPLITTSANGAAGSMVVDGDNGFIIEPGDAEGLARAMAALLDKSARENMGRRSLEIVRHLCNRDRETAGFHQALWRAALSAGYLH